MPSCPHPRREQARSWLYRIKPLVTHEPYRPLNFPAENLTAEFSTGIVTPNQLRWKPFPYPSEKVDWVRSLFTMCGSGSAAAKEGFAIHMYTANDSMGDSCLSNADGELLLVPQDGTLLITTEFGILEVAPTEVCVIPRGVHFKVELPDGCARGYVLELFQSRFQLPDLGPIGSNCLAAPRDFASPVAWFQDTDGPFTILHKLEGKLFSCQQAFSPFNVVAWHGNYVPYKYDLNRFCPINAVAFDHPDPSIFTVLTAPSPIPGCAVADFVIFPPRVNATKNTFRPPYYHRNIQNEFMGLIKGVYEAKRDGFQPGGASLHLCMTPHGPDTATYEASIKESAEALLKLEGTLAFMFETHMTPRTTPQALGSPCIDRDYYQCWMGLRKHFVHPGGAAAASGSGGGGADALGASTTALGSGSGAGIGGGDVDAGAGGAAGASNGGGRGGEGGGVAASSNGEAAVVQLANGVAALAAT
ncbi:hypothetical protein FOA52_008495 [Chlamydomonas sp. UWO 241]|nr:hypothetical protein FOA52_008495 [Chlamydomonas sp. UWO 241]